MKALILLFFGFAIFCCGGWFEQTVSRDYHAKQINQRDSVNTHNIKVIDSLNEYIRLDSLTQLEQLYPKK